MPNVTCYNISIGKDRGASIIAGRRAFVIRAFGLRDSLFVHRLQKQGVWLDMDQALLCARAPLWIALATPVAWRVNGIATYILHAQLPDQQIEGFVQVQKCPDRAEANLLFLSPDLSAPEAPEIWRRLLLHVCRKAGDNDIQRLYASLPDDAEALSALRDAGFSLYTREDLFRIDMVSTLSTAHPGEVRPVLEADTWQLRRLYTQYTPQPVQLAEGALATEHRLPFLADVEWGETRNLVLVEGQDIGGSVQIRSGRSGHLVRLWGGTSDPGRVERLLAAAVEAGAGDLPIYCAVRDYQGGVRALLEDAGAAYVGRSARLVRHIQRLERVPVAAAAPALDPRAEPATTLSHIEAAAHELPAESSSPAYKLS